MEWVLLCCFSQSLLNCKNDIAQRLRRICLRSIYDDLKVSILLLRWKWSCPAYCTVKYQYRLLLVFGISLIQFKLLSITFNAWLAEYLGLWVVRILIIRDEIWIKNNEYINDKQWNGRFKHETHRIVAILRTSHIFN